jgi:O-antigen/teichoic acid export membrane protein
VLVTFDRMALGAILGSAAVGYYTAPYEAATRLLAVATSAFAALFPAITSELARGERWRTNRVLESTLRQMLLVFALPTILLFAFAPELLRAWLGTEFAERGTTAFRLLLIGVLANALAHVPFVYLYAAGRPDIPAKNHLLELVIHIPLTIVLIRGIGPAGAATAWTVRVLLDAGLLFWAASRSGGLDRQSAQLRYWRSALGCVLFLLGVGAVITLSGGLQLAAGVGLAAIGALLYALAAWLLALRPEERAAWLGLLAGLKRSRSG